MVPRSIRARVRRRAAPVPQRVPTIMSASPPPDLVSLPARGPFPRRTAEPPLTTDQRILAIEELLRRVNGYAKFTCRTDGLEGTSTEAREKAVAAFYERMSVLERQLGRIHEDYQLG